jgi:hypothetical protein
MLTFCPIFHLVIFIRLRPDDFVVDVTGLKDQQEVQWPETVATDVSQEGPQETKVEDIMRYYNVNYNKTQLAMARIFVSWSHDQMRYLPFKHPSKDILLTEAGWSLCLCSCGRREVSTTPNSTVRKLLEHKVGTDNRTARSNMTTRTATYETS